MSETLTSLQLPPPPDPLPQGEGGNLLIYCYANSPTARSMALIPTNGAIIPPTP